MRSKNKVALAVELSILSRSVNVVEGQNLRFLFKMSIRKFEFFPHSGLEGRF